MAGLVVIRGDIDMQNQFESYRNQCGRGKKAVNALVHTIARRCYGVLKSGKSYDANIPKSIANMAA